MKIWCVVPFFFFFFTSNVFSIYFLDLNICYQQVLVQEWWHCIMVKILDPLDLGAFLYKIDSSFFFFFIHSKEFSICLLELFIRYQQFFVQKRRHCIPVKTLFFLKNFSFVSWTSIYAIYKFSFKNSNSAFRSKFLTSRN